MAELFHPLPVRAALEPVTGAGWARLPPRVADLLPPQAAPQRRRTYAAGRLAAARAGRQLTGRSLWPLRAPGGAPSWPAGVCGSISHTDGLAVGVVTGAEHTAIGVDLEELGRADRLGPLSSWVLGPAERARLAALPAEARPLAGLRLLCAKEALYKAGSAAGDERLRLRWLSVHWTEPEDPSAAVPMTVAPAGGAGGYTPFTVRSRVLGGFMVAAAVLTRR
ncbi:4'-phosphopantetheinyl transferase superfamily protein [Streptomyces sp. TP-A0874]|uniref:4'-phosphopantetheinyl transferase superfamily protein n=1 Tax=Streptomyces sp. TP-A0874 TaxID=549819 RepID=UPI0008532C11|nr:4'-phosphopantetheinyl transferase superfamily protein [Streptomyces sp. TP-A0874]